MSRRPLNLAGKKNRFRTLTIENLEVRQLLSATNAAGGTGQVQVGTLSPLHGAPDYVSIRTHTNSYSRAMQAPTSPRLQSTPKARERLSTIKSWRRLRPAHKPRRSASIELQMSPRWRRTVTDIVFNGYGGNDTFTNKTAINCEAHGGDGDDTLIGGYGFNYLYGDAGNDTLTGGDFGNDIDGGLGNDTIKGGAMADYIFGRDGDDIIDAGNGNNYVDGGVGNDTIKCGVGDDSIVGGDGNDSIDAGAGNDLVYGGNGDDFIFGNAGNDTLYGEAGNDTIDGGVGADIIRGGAGNDTLYGQKGNFWGRRREGRLLWRRRYGLRR